MAVVRPAQVEELEAFVATQDLLVSELNISKYLEDEGDEIVGSRNLPQTMRKGKEFEIIFAVHVLNFC